MLDAHQREIFSFIEKPVISLKSEKPIDKSASNRCYSYIAETLYTKKGQVNV